MFKIIEKRLVDGWQLFYKRISVWLAVIFSSLTTIVAANQSTYFALVNYLPKGALRVIALAVLWLALIIVPTLAVLWKQKSLDHPNGG